MNIYPYLFKQTIKSHHSNFHSSLKIGFLWLYNILYFISHELYFLYKVLILINSFYSKYTLQLM